MSKRKEPAKRIRRPAISGRRIQGLLLLADRVRIIARSRAGANWLSQLPPQEAPKVRTAITYIDQLESWHKQSKESKTP